MQYDDLPQGLLQALLLPLTSLLLPIVGNNKDLAWDDAVAATSSFGPMTLIEFRLATRIAAFNIRANQLTAQAADPGLTPAGAVRMGQCALSYAREADKAERRLEKLQAARMEEEKRQPEPAQAEPAITPARGTATLAEPALLPAETTTPQAEPSIPAYKLLKQLRRLAKQREREARLKAPTENRAENPAEASTETPAEAQAQAPDQAPAKPKTQACP